MKFPQILKELRQEKGLSQRKIALQIGYSKAILSCWETGNAQPTAEAIITLAKFFDVTTDYLLGLEHEDGSKIK